MSLATWMTAMEEPDETQQYVSIRGARMRCLVSGSGPSLLLLHGLLGTAEAWNAASERLSLFSTVYAPDALGIGGSDRVPNLDVSLSGAADRLVTLLDAQGVEQADVVGTSHGGAIALMLAARHPERVRSLTLHAPANPFSDVAEPLIRFYRTALGRWFAGHVPSVPVGMQSVALGRMYGDVSRVRAGSLDRYVASLRVPGTISYVLNILDRWEQDMAALKDVLPRLRHVPALLLWGDRDRAVSLKSGERLAEYFDRAAMVVIPGAGHLPHEEFPIAFAGAVNGFLGGLKRDIVHPINGLHIVARHDAA